MAGLPGTGKSTLARAAAARVDGAVLDKDQVRAALFAPADIEYSAAQDDFIMDLMLDTARWLWRQRPDRVIFLDGRTFSQAYQRRRAIAAAPPGRWRMIECVCSPGTALDRLARDRGTHPAANRDAALYERVRASFEPITERRLVLDTEQPLEGLTGELLRALE